MAEHLRNELARSGAAIRPSQVMTLAHFLDGRRDIPAAAPPALLHLLIREALERLQPAALSGGRANIADFTTLWPD